jgi:putative flavoprotein involved in K+ transport
MNEMSNSDAEQVDVLIVGAGQSGLSMSACLSKRGIKHIVLEKKYAVHTWHNERWDSFCLVTPNWQCKLPDYSYRGPDPHGFMVKSEILDYLRGFIEHVNAPMVEGVSVEKIKPVHGAFDVKTSKGAYRAGQVVIASGGYQIPIIPRFAERIAPEIQQVHSQQYKNPSQLKEGAVLVVGSGQSGAQIAEDLHLAGRKVYLVVHAFIAAAMSPTGSTRWAPTTSPSSIIHRATRCAITPITT